jgi:hypothetical protein
MNSENHLVKKCKTCEKVILDSPPFCPHCWAKAFTEEEFEKSDRVWVVRTKQDLYECVERAKEAPLHTYVLIEGELTQQISKAFDARSKLAIKRKNKKLELAGSIASAVGGVAVQVLIKQPGSKINPSELLKRTAPSVVGTVVTGAGLVGVDDDDEEFKALSFASECNSMFNANFRLIRNPNDHLILRRERAMADNVSAELKGTANDFKGVTEDFGNELKGAAKDLKGVAEDVSSLAKKGWNWFKSI